MMRAITNIFSYVTLGEIRKNLLILALVLLFLEYFLPTGTLGFLLLLALGTERFLAPKLALFVIAPAIWLSYFLLLYVVEPNEQINIYSIYYLLAYYIVLVVGYWQLERFKKKIQYEYVTELNYLNDEMIYFDQNKLDALHMNDSEQKFYRKLLNEKYQHYLYLKSINWRLERKVSKFSNTQVLIQQIFNELVQEPQKVLDADNFLYRLLPDYTQLVKDYLDLEENMLKTDEDAELKQIALTRIKLYNEEFSEELNRLKQFKNL